MKKILLRIKHKLNIIKTSIKKELKLFSKKEKYAIIRNSFFLVVFALVFVLNISVNYKVSASTNNLDTFTIEGIETWNTPDACLTSENGSIGSYECYKWSVENIAEKIVTESEKEYKYVATTEQINLFNKYGWIKEFKPSSLTTYWNSTKDFFTDENDDSIGYQYLGDGSYTKYLYELKQYVPVFTETGEQEFLHNYIFNENSSYSYFNVNSDEYNRFDEVIINEDYTELNSNYLMWVYNGDYYPQKTINEKYGNIDSIITKNEENSLYTIKNEYELQTLGTSYRSLDINGNDKTSPSFSTVSYIFNDGNGKAYYIYDAVKEKFAKFIFDDEINNIDWRKEVETQMDEKGIIFLPLNNDFAKEIKEKYEYTQKISEQKYTFSSDLYSNEILNDTENKKYELYEDETIIGLKYYLENPIIGSDIVEYDITDYNTTCPSNLGDGVICRDSDIISTKYTYNFTKDYAVNDGESYWNLSANLEDYNTVLVDTTIDKVYNQYSKNKKYYVNTIKSGTATSDKVAINSLNNFLCSNVLAFNSHSECYKITAMQTVWSPTSKITTKKLEKSNNLSSWMTEKTGQTLNEHIFTDENNNTFYVNKPDETAMFKENDKYYGVNGAISYDTYNYSVAEPYFQYVNSGTEKRIDVPDFVSTENDILQKTSNTGIWHSLKNEEASYELNSYKYEDTNNYSYTDWTSETPSTNRYDVSTTSTQYLGPCVFGRPTSQCGTQTVTTTKSYYKKGTNPDQAIMYSLNLYENITATGYQTITAEKWGYEFRISRNGKWADIVAPLSFFNTRFYDRALSVNPSSQKWQRISQNDGDAFDFENIVFYIKATNDKWKNDSDWNVVKEGTFSKIPAGYVNDGLGLYGVFAYENPIHLVRNFDNSKKSYSLQNNLNNFKNQNGITFSSKSALSTQNAITSFVFPTDGREYLIYDLWETGYLDSPTASYAGKTNDEFTFLTKANSGTSHFKKLMNYQRGSTPYKTTTPNASNGFNLNVSPKNGGQIYFDTDGLYKMETKVQYGQTLKTYNLYKWTPTKWVDKKTINGSELLLGSNTSLNTNTNFQNIIKTNTIYNNDNYFPSSGNNCSLTSNSKYCVKKIEGSKTTVYRYFEYTLNTSEQEISYSGETIISAIKPTSKTIDKGNGKTEIIDYQSTGDVVYTYNIYDILSTDNGDGTLVGTKYSSELGSPLVDHTTLPTSVNASVKNDLGVCKVYDNYLICPTNGYYYSQNTDEFLSVSDEERLALSQKPLTFWNLEESYTFNGITLYKSYDKKYYVAGTDSKTLTNSFYIKNDRTIYQYQNMKANTLTLYETEVIDNKNLPIYNTAYGNYSLCNGTNFLNGCYSGPILTKTEHKYQLYIIDENSIIGRTTDQYNENGNIIKKDYYVYTSFDNYENNIEYDVYNEIELKTPLTEIDGIKFCNAKDFSKSEEKCIKYVKELDEHLTYYKQKEYRLLTYNTETNLVENAYKTYKNSELIKTEMPVSNGTSIINSNKTKNVFDAFEWFFDDSNAQENKTINSNKEFEFTGPLNFGKTVSLSGNTNYVFSFKGNLVNGTNNLNNYFKIITGSNEYIKHFDFINDSYYLEFKTDGTGIIRLSLILEEDLSKVVFTNMQIETKESFDINGTVIYHPYINYVVGNLYHIEKTLVETLTNYYKYKAVQNTWYKQTININDVDTSFSNDIIENYFYGSSLSSLTMTDDIRHLNDKLNEIELEQFVSGTYNYDNTNCDETNCRFVKTGRYIEKLYNYKLNLSATRNYENSLYKDVNSVLDSFKQTKDSNNQIGYYLNYNDVNDSYIIYDLETNKYYIKNKNDIYKLYDKFKDEGGFTKNITFSTEEEINNFVTSFLSEKYSKIENLKNYEVQGNKEYFTNLENNTIKLEVPSNDYKIYTRLLLKENDTFNFVVEVEGFGITYFVSDRTGEYKIEFVIKNDTEIVSSVEFPIVVSSANDIIKLTADTHKLNNNYSIENIILKTKYQILSDYMFGFEEEYEQYQENYLFRKISNFIGKTSEEFSVSYTKIEQYKPDNKYNSSTNYTKNKYILSVINADKYGTSDYVEPIYRQYEIYTDQGHWSLLQENYEADIAKLGYYKYANVEGWYNTPEEFLNEPSLEGVKNINAIYSFYAYNNPYVLKYPDVDNISLQGNTYNSSDILFTYTGKIKIKYSLKENTTSTNSYKFNNIMNYEELEVLNIGSYPLNSNVNSLTQARTKNILSFYNATSQLKNYFLITQPIPSLFKDRNEGAYEIRVNGFEKNGIGDDITLTSTTSPFITEKFFGGDSDEVIGEHIMINRGLVDYTYDRLVDYDYNCSNSSDCLIQNPDTNDATWSKRDQYKNEQTGFAYDYYTLGTIFDAKTNVTTDYYSFLNDIVKVINVYLESVSDWNTYINENGDRGGDGLEVWEVQTEKSVLFGLIKYDGDKDFITYELNFEDNFTDKLFKRASEQYKQKQSTIISKLESLGTASGGGLYTKYLYLLENDGLLRQFFNNTLIQLYVTETKDNGQLIYNVRPLALNDTLKYTGTNLLFNLYAQSMANAGMLSNNKYIEGLTGNETLFDIIKKGWDTSNSFVIQRGDKYFIYYKDFAPIYANTITTERLFDPNGEFPKIFDGKNSFASWNGEFSDNGQNNNPQYASAIALGNSIPRLSYSNELELFKPLSYVVYSDIITKNYYGKDNINDAENRKYQELAFAFEAKGIVDEYDYSGVVGDNAMKCDALENELLYEAEKYGSENEAFGIFAGTKKYLQLSSELRRLGCLNDTSIVKDGTIFEWVMRDASLSGYNLEKFIGSIQQTTNNIFGEDTWDGTLFGLDAGYVTNVLKGIGSAGETIWNSVKAGGEQLWCWLSDVFGDCKRVTTYDVLFHTHISANTVNYGWYYDSTEYDEFGRPDENSGQLILQKYKTKDLYSKLKNEVTLPGSIGNELLLDIDYDFEDMETNGNLFRSIDSNGMLNVNNFEIRLNKLTIPYTFAKKLEADDLKYFSTIEYSLYTTTKNDKCSTGFRYYNGYCYLENSNILDDNKLWAYTKNFNTEKDNNQNIIINFAKKLTIDKDGNFVFLENPLIINNLDENTNYVFEMKIRGLDGLVINSTPIKKEFKTSYDMVNNPYGNVLQTYGTTNDYGNVLDPSTVIFKHNGIEYTNLDWMNEYIYSYVRDAFWTDADMCLTIKDELTQKFCEAIPEKYHVQTYEEGNNLIGGRLVFRDEEGKIIDVSKVAFAIDKGVSGADLITTRSNVYFNATKNGLEILDFNKIDEQTGEYKKWVLENYLNDSDPVEDFILNFEKYNLEILSDPNDVFKNVEKYYIEWQGYYSPFTKLHYMDYNQNGKYDTVSLSKTYYDSYGKPTNMEFSEILNSFNAEFKGDYTSVEQTRMSYKFNRDGKTYEYLVIYRNEGTPILIK